MDGTLTVHDVAKKCQVCEATVRKWIKERKLKAIQPKPGGMYHTCEAWLKEFIESGKEPKE